MRAHDEQVVFAFIGKFRNGFTGRADTECTIYLQVVPFQEGGHGFQHFGGAFYVEVFGDFGADDGACPWGQRRFYCQCSESAVAAKRFHMGGQISQHFFRMGAAIYREQDFHERLLFKKRENNYPKV